jgi:Uma2 family endonuclease
MSTVSFPAEPALLLEDVDWKTYTRLLRAFDKRRSLRLIYNRGSLEITTLTHEHESYAHLLGRFVVVLTEEFGLPIKGGGSTTFRRRKQRKGLEADESYWIANEPLVRGKDRIDLRIDPPPDLALEIDVTHSSLDRLAIYAALRIPEVWWREGESIVCYLLGQTGNFAVSPTSKAFPGLAPADLVQFLALRTQMDENALVRRFRTWVQQHFPRQRP